MTITSDVLSKKTVSLYEAKVVGEIFCVLTDGKSRKIRFFGIKTNGNDAEELYFPPAAVVGFSDAVTIKNRAALKGRFSLPGGLKRLPLGGECYTPDGKLIGALDAIETENGAITAFVAGGTSFPSSRLVSLSAEIVILSETDDKYRLVPPKTRVPKVKDDRTVTIALSSVEPIPPIESIPAATEVAERDETAKAVELSGITTEKPRTEAKVTAFPAPAAVSTNDEPNKRGEPVLPAESNDEPNKPTVKPVVLPAATVTTESENAARAAAYAPPVRSSVVLPPKADVTVTRTPLAGATDKAGYSFLIGKTATRTILADDGGILVSEGETLTAETLSKATGKLVLLALYSK